MNEKSNSKKKNKCTSLQTQQNREAQAPWVVRYESKFSGGSDHIGRSITCRNCRATQTPYVRPSMSGPEGVELPV